MEELIAKRVEEHETKERIATVVHKGEKRAEEAEELAAAAALGARQAIDESAAEEAERQRAVNAALKEAAAHPPHHHHHAHHEHHEHHESVPPTAAERMAADARKGIHHEAEHESHPAASVAPGGKDHSHDVEKIAEHRQAARSEKELIAQTVHKGEQAIEREELRQAEEALASK